MNSRNSKAKVSEEGLLNVRLICEAMRIIKEDVLELVLGIPGGGQMKRDFQVGEIFGEEEEYHFCEECGGLQAPSGTIDDFAPDNIFYCSCEVIE